MVVATYATAGSSAAQLSAHALDLSNSAKQTSGDIQAGNAGRLARASQRWRANCPYARSDGEVFRRSIQTQRALVRWTIVLSFATIAYALAAVLPPLFGSPRRHVPCGRTRLGVVAARHLSAKSGASKCLSDSEGVQPRARQSAQLLSCRVWRCRGCAGRSGAAFGRERHEWLLLCSPDTLDHRAEGK